MYWVSIPVLKMVKDWIAADFETWERVMNNKDEVSYRVTVLEDEGKNKGSRKVKK